MSLHDRLCLRDYGPSPGSHSHAHFQVLVGLGGVLELEVEGRGQRLGAGDTALVAPGERHDFISAAGSRCLVLDTRQDLWRRCTPAPARHDDVVALATYLARSLQAGQPLATLYGPALLLEAWKPAARVARTRRTIDWAELAEWVQARLHQPLTVAQLAERVFLSPSQFAARCQEVQGASPLDWLRAQRLARARTLRDAGLPVAEVACRTGYRSPSALTAALRRAGLR
ncbi:MAG: AraC family transcriptional regulator [Pseudomonadota bacterium]